MLRTVASVLILLVCSVSFGGSGLAQVAKAPNAKVRSPSHVYFFTGFMGVGSRLDQVAATVKRRGVPMTMSSPGGWGSLAQSAIKGYRSEGLRSIVIVGYSAGGGAALDMAAQLNPAKVPVQLVLLIDGSSGSISPNVRRVINFYVPGGYGAPIARSANFRGTLQNIPAKNPNAGHFSIIDMHQQQLLGYVLASAR